MSGRQPMATGITTRLPSGSSMACRCWMRWAVSHRTSAGSPDLGRFFGPRNRDLLHRTKDSCASSCCGRRTYIRCLRPRASQCAGPFSFAWRNYSERHVFSQSHVFLQQCLTCERLEPFRLSGGLSRYGDQHEISKIGFRHTSYDHLDRSRVGSSSNAGVGRVSIYGTNSFERAQSVD